MIFFCYPDSFYKTSYFDLFKALIILYLDLEEYFLGRDNLQAWATLTAKLWRRPRRPRRSPSISPGTKNFFMLFHFDNIQEIKNIKVKFCQVDLNPNSIGEGPGAGGKNTIFDFFMFAQ